MRSPKWLNRYLHSVDSYLEPTRPTFISKPENKISLYLFSFMLRSLYTSILEEYTGI